MFCEHCGEKITRPIPVEPMYDIDVVAFLAPCKLTTLRAYLKRRKHEFPYRYRIVGEGQRPYRKRKIRQLTVSEVRRIRAHFVRTLPRTGQAGQAPT